MCGVHHEYLKKNLPLVKTMVGDFAVEHSKKFSWLAEMERKFELLSLQLQLSMKKEEEVIFPYIRRVTHAYRDNEPYIKLLVRTLRKPMEETMSADGDRILSLLSDIRELTGQYQPASNVCTSHKVVLAKLRELDNDISHHSYLERSILYPRAIGIEKEVLAM